MGRRLRKLRPYLWPGGRWRWPLRALVLLVPMLVMMVVSVEVTSQSWFCNSCHIMGPYYASWKAGTHAQIDCVACHIAPGATNFIAAKLNGAGQVVDDLLHRTSTKPSASVSDMACTRSGCHAIETVRATKKAPGGKYLFDHAKHLDLTYSGLAMHCTSCHSHVKGQNHFEVNTDTCVTCHLQKPSAPAKGRDAVVTLVSMPATPAAAVAAAAGPAGKAPPDDCKSCHVPPQQVIDYRGVQVNHAEYVSYGADCRSCHSGVTEKPRPIRDEACFTCHEFGLERRHATTEELHRVHNEGRHKVECFSCHGETKHGPAAQSMQLAEVDCRSCHVGQHSVQQATYAPSDLPPHARGAATIAAATTASASGALSPMFMVHVSCSACHVEPRPVKVRPDSGAMVLAATKSACDNCHKPGAGEQVDVWQKGTRTLYDGVVAMLPPADRPLTPAQAQRVREARELLDLVRLDGSWGVHNPKYTQKLLEDAQQKLMLLEPATRPAAPVTPATPATRPAP